MAMFASVSYLSSCKTSVFAPLCDLQNHTTHQCFMFTSLYHIQHHARCHLSAALCHIQHHTSLQCWPLCHIQHHTRWQCLPHCVIHIFCLFVLVSYSVPSYFCDRPFTPTWVGFCPDINFSVGLM